ncbi:thermonuclease family protein [Leptolyngbya sp. FACHB-711]|nr:thermonuclease family protein [Leptolyngbya sp. FACHB-711]
MIAAANNTVIVMVNDTDRQGRKIADVLVSDPQPDAPEQEKFLNYEIVSAGLADIHTAYVESCFNRSLLVQGGREAKQSRRRI